jgi:hypothetical protein
MDPLEFFASDHYRRHNSRRPTRIPRLLVAIFRPQGVPRQRNSITGDFVDSQNGKLLAPLGRNSLLVFILRRTSAVFGCRI